MENKISKNIAFLRKKKGWTQQDLSEKLKIPRPTLGGYERAYSEPGIEGILKLARIFNVSVEDLIARRLWEGETRMDHPGELKVLAISVNEENKSNIELVEAKAEAGYTESFDDPAYIKKLPRIFLPTLKEGTFRAFEIRGDSMLPMNESDIVVCSFVERIQDVKDGSTYVLVTKEEGLVYKRLKKNERSKKMVLISDNDLYAPYELPYSAIAELWKYESHISFTEPGLAAKAWMDSRLESMARDIKQIKSRVLFNE